MANNLLLNLLRSKAQHEMKGTGTVGGYGGYDYGYGLVGGTAYQDRLKELVSTGMTRKEAVAYYTANEKKPAKVPTQRAPAKRPKKTPEQVQALLDKKYRAKAIKQLQLGKKHFSLCNDTSTKLRKNDIETLKAKVAQLEQIMELM